MSELKHQIGEATKQAMKARDKARVATLRMVNAELKRVEVDERRDLVDADVLAILGKMVKQRQDALSQFTDAGRMELADKERYEIDVIETFLPTPLDEAELSALIDACIAETGAAGKQDMGKVMAAIKVQAGGRADLGAASRIVAGKLG